VGIIPVISTNKQRQAVSYRNLARYFSNNVVVVSNTEIMDHYQGTPLAVQ
jgi:hypothetical protein